MRRRSILLGVALIALGGAAFFHLHWGRSSAPLAHSASSFSFDINAPLAIAAPLFGASGEREWAGKDWNPHFLYPVVERDIAGEVFTTPHGHGDATWVNTALDLQNGHIQYVYFVPDGLTVTVDVQLTSVSANRTRVKVSYSGTALDSVANAHVMKMEESHSDTMGREWEKQIATALSARR